MYLCPRVVVVLLRVRLHLLDARLLLRNLLVGHLEVAEQKFDGVRLDLQVFDGLRHCVFAVRALVRPKGDGGRQRTFRLPHLKVYRRH